MSDDRIRLRNRAAAIVDQLELAERIALAYFVLRSPSTTVYPERTEKLLSLRLVAVVAPTSSGKRQYAILPLGKLVDATLRADESAVERALVEITEEHRRVFLS